MNRILCLVAALLVGASAAANAPQLNPEPRQMTGEYERIALPEGGVRIVLGTRASDPEEYAAERLQALAQRRLHSLWPIVRESPSLPDGDWRVLVGRTESHDALSAAWDAAGFTMPEAAFAPGRDGFAIEVLPAERLVLVAGANERGVIYGVQALVQLLRADGNNTTMPLVSVRDWASIPWRGRKHIQRFPTTDELDAFMWARLNYSILMPDKTDAETRALLREARRRGIFVYANILCAVGPEAFDATVDRTREFIAMGVDGLHFSFDDDGPGQETHLLMRRLLDLGREHGITGRAISITSIPGGYTNINNSFNRERVQIPGMEEAIWFFTRVPAREDVEQARALGLRTLPAWHHNWPRVRGGGFTHASGGGASFMIERHAGFVGVPPLTHGWGELEVTLLLSDLKERTTDSSSEILAVGPIRFVEVIEPE